MTTSVTEIEAVPRSGPVRPRPYQVEAIAAVAEARRAGKQFFQVAIPTGGGKTLVGNDVVAAELAGGGRVLWMSKDWRLLEQAAGDLRRRHGRGRRMGRIGGTGTALHPLPEDHGSVRYSTLQTLGQRGRQVLRQFRPTLVVWDECHWGDEGKAGRVLKRLLRAQSIPVLGLTATPRDGDFEVIYRRSFAELVEDGYLARFDIAQPATGCAWRPSLNAFEDFDAASLKKLAASRKRNTLIVDHWIEHSRRYGKTMVFACFKQHADRLMRMFVERGVPARVVHSGRNARDNAAALELFRSGQIQVLINVAMLTHGIDVPDARTVLLARPTASDILFAQMVGRAARLAEGKDRFHIVELTDNVEQHGEHLYSARDFYTGAGFRSDAPSAASNGSGMRRSAVRSRHGYDPAGQPTWIAEGAPEEARGLWYRQDQSFGIELELTRDDFSPDLGARRWRRHAMDLRDRLAARLGDRVAAEPIAEYSGVAGGAKDYRLWHVERDNSAGWEVTSPVLQNAEGFSEIIAACRALGGAVEEGGFKVNWKTGFHLHLGWRSEGMRASVERTLRLIGLARLFEPALATLVAPSRICRFDGTRYHAGEPNPYCGPLSAVLGEADLDGVSSYESLRALLVAHQQRYTTLNLVPLWSSTGTVEVRLHGGTIDPAKILLWTSLWQQLLWAAERRGDIDAPAPRDAIVPDGDVVALARQHLPDARQPQQRRLLERLDRRRREVLELWKKQPELADWTRFAAEWMPP